MALSNKKPSSMSFEWYQFISHLSIKRVLIGSILFSGVLPVIISIFEGTAFVSVEYPDFPYFGKFIVWPISFILLFPILNTFAYLFYRNSIDAVIIATQNGVISFNKSGSEVLRSHLQKARNKWKLIGIGVFALIVTLGYWTGPTLMFKLQTWCHGEYGGYSLLFFCATIIWFVEVLIILSVFYDFYLWRKAMRIVVYDDKDIKFVPLLFHPDNSAGLSMFGDAALKLYYFVFTLWIFTCVQFAEKLLSDPNLSVLEILLKYKAVPVSITSLLMLLPVVLIFPLTPFHSRLQELKSDYLNKIRSTIHDTLPAYQHNILNGSTEMRSEHLEHFDDISKMKASYTAIKEIPEWPFDVVAVRSIIYSIVVPSVLFILQEIILR